MGGDEVDGRVTAKLKTIHLNNQLIQRGATLPYRRERHAVVRVARGGF